MRRHLPNLRLVLPLTLLAVFLPGCKSIEHDAAIEAFESGRSKDGVVVLSVTRGSSEQNLLIMNESLGLDIYALNGNGVVTGEPLYSMGQLEGALLVERAKPLSEGRYGKVLHAFLPPGDYVMFLHKTVKTDMGIVVGVETKLLPTSYAFTVKSGSINYLGEFFMACKDFTSPECIELHRERDRDVSNVRASWPRLGKAEVVDVEPTLLEMEERYRRSSR